MGRFAFGNSEPIDIPRLLRQVRCSAQTWLEVDPAFSPRPNPHLQITLPRQD